MRMLIFSSIDDTSLLSRLSELRYDNSATTFGGNIHDTSGSTLTKTVNPVHPGVTRSDNVSRFSCCRPPRYRCCRQPEEVVQGGRLQAPTLRVRNDPNVESYDPDLWTDEFYFLNQPGQAEIQSDLFYDYRTNVDAYPKWQAWMRQKQPRLLVIWGKYDLSFDPSEPEAYRRDVSKAEVHVLDAGHFALDTAADEIAALVQGFVGSSREGGVARRAG